MVDLNFLRRRSEEKEEMASAEQSRTNSTIDTSSPRPSELERRNSLASLSVAADDPRQFAGEPNWPRDRRAYMSVLAGWILMFNSWGIVNAFGTYNSYYKETILPSQSILLLNLVGSMNAFIILLMSAPVGRFLDAGYTRSLLITGAILTAIGCFLLSVVNGDGGHASGHYGGIWATQGLTMGLGMASFFVSASQVPATWFGRKKGLIIGIVASGASAGGLVYPVMVRYLAPKIGFNNAQRCVAALTTITSIAAILLAKPKPSHVKRVPAKWADYRVFIDLNARHNRAYVWLTIAIFFLFMGFYPVFFNLEEWAAANGIAFRAGHPTQEGPIATYYLLITMNAASSIGRVFSAYLCDHYGALNVHAVVTLLGSLLILILWTLAKDFAPAIVFVILFGIISGAIIGLPPASVAYILGPDPAEQAKLGQWTGMMYSGAAIPALIGPIIAGYLITKFNNNFITVQMWSGSCIFVSGLCMCMAIFEKRRAEKRAKKASELGKTVSTATSTINAGVSRESTRLDMA